MKRLNALFYTKGKFGKNIRETLDKDNEYLYSEGKYPTKIKKEDLPDDYIEFRSRAIWYMTGYIKTSGVVDVSYKAMKINHLFKDDYLYISYHEKLKSEKNELGFEDYINYDLVVCGNDIVRILLAIEKNSKVDIEHIKEKIYDKFYWWKDNCSDDYKRCFGEKEVDVFEIFK